MRKENNLKYKTRGKEAKRRQNGRKWKENFEEMSQQNFRTWMWTMTHLEAGKVTIQDIKDEPVPCWGAPGW